MWSRIHPRGQVRGGIALFWPNDETDFVDNVCRPHDRSICHVKMLRSDDAVSDEGKNRYPTRSFYL